MSVGSKLVFGSMLAVLPLVAGLLFVGKEVDDLTRANRRLASVQLSTAVGSLSILQSLDELEEHLSKFLVSGDPGYAAKFKEAQARLDSALERLLALSLTESEKRAVERFGTHWHNFINSGVTATRDSQEGLAAREQALAESKRVFRDLERQGRQILIANRRAMAFEAKEASRAGQRADRISLVVILSALLASVLVLGLTLRAISKPLRSLLDGTRAVAKGQLSFRVREHRRDEFGELASAFNNMVENLWQLSRAQSEFISHASHELKTPIVAMQETNRLLLDDVAGPLGDKQRRFVELNFAAADRLSGMITDLLDLSRLESGMRYEMAEQDLALLVREATEALEAKALSQGIALKVRHDNTVLSAPVICDRDRIMQVVQNLVDNAISATPSGGKIVVSIAGAATHKLPPVHSNKTQTRTIDRRADYILVTVSDTGTGIAESERGKVFDRFYRSPQGNRGGRDHVGLGLAICREIVHAHGGAIWVTAAQEGGAEFCFLLPHDGRRQSLTSG